MNSYLLEGSDSLSIKNERDKIIQENHFENAFLSTYDMEEVELDRALEDLDTYGLFSDQKVVVIQNIEVLKQDDYKESFDHLFRYIASPNPNNLLIIEARKLNNTLKLTKELKKVCKVVESTVTPRKFIQDCLKDYKIDPSSLSLLDEYCLGDFTKIYNECLKLKNYKFSEKVITSDDIKEICFKKLGDSQDLVFSFTRSIAEKNKSDALKKYKELLNYNVDSLSIIGLLGSQLRIILQVKILDSRGMRITDMAKTLGEKEFRVKKTMELIGLYSKDEILDLMKRLSEIDLRIKTSDTDPNTEIELFILNILL